MLKTLNFVNSHYPDTIPIDEMISELNIIVQQSVQLIEHKKTPNFSI